MNVVPIVFCFDDNMEMPAGVCIASLMESSNETTFYDIIILHAEGCTFPISGRLHTIADHYHNCKISYRSVGNVFDKAYETRGVTVATYYRLLIADLVPEYDKVMYHDVDVIFRTDLSSLFFSTDMQGFYMAGVLSPGSLDEQVRKYRAKMGFHDREYILAGNLLINSLAIRNDGVTELFKKEVMGTAYKYQDMDIINLVCKGKIKKLPPFFCGTIEIFRLAAKGIVQNLYSQEELDEVLQFGIVHYNGPKPWQQYCPNFDYWWFFYRKSIYFDAAYYFDFFESRLDIYKGLSLRKRIKLLVRFFIK